MVEWLFFIDLHIRAIHSDKNCVSWLSVLKAVLKKDLDKRVSWHFATKSTDNLLLTTVSLMSKRALSMMHFHFLIVLLSEFKTTDERLCVSYSLRYISVQMRCFGLASCGKLSLATILLHASAQTSKEQPMWLLNVSFSVFLLSFSFTFRILTSSLLKSRGEWRTGIFGCICESPFQTRSCRRSFGQSREKNSY